MSKRISSNEAALSSALKWAVMGIVSLVVIFGDVMFIKLMWNHFPDGLLRIGALGGAVATALSIIVLLLGKAHWFRPGGQLIAAYLFTAVEVCVSILNVLYASGVADGMMRYWEMMSPATPFVALVGWTIILQLDRSTQERHEDMEMEDDINKSERAFRRQQHEAGMRIRLKALEYNEQYMMEALESPYHQQAIQSGAEKLTVNAIHQLTGRYIPPAGTTVQSSIAEPKKAPEQKASKQKMEPVALSDSTPDTEPLEDDGNSRLSNLVAELRDLVGQDKANGFDLSHFAEDLKALVNNTPPSSVSPARGLKRPLPASGTPAQEDEDTDPQTAPLNQKQAHQ
jgi:hypothetical protein